MPKTLVEIYDGIYAKDANAYGTDPVPLVVQLTEHLVSGSILEIGAGAGRNSVFLASRGYDVTATDISPQSIAVMNKKATDVGISLRAHLMDIATADLQELYDAIIATFVLHHLEKTVAVAAIKKMQAHTMPGGFNLITTFTKDGDFFRHDPETTEFYLENKDELEQLYAGWKIIKLFDRAGQARATGNDGQPLSNVFIGLIAQK